MPNPKTQSGINTVEAHICFDRRPLVHGIIFLLVKLQPSGSISFENANVPIVGAAPRTIKRKPKTNDQKGAHSKYSQLLKPERKTETCKQGWWSEHDEAQKNGNTKHFKLWHFSEFMSPVTKYGLRPKGAKLLLHILTNSQLEHYAMPIHERNPNFQNIHQKLIPNFQQFSPLSFFVVAESPNMNSVFFFQFLLKNPWENSQIRNFNSSFSALL